MIHWREEGEIVRQGLSFYPPKCTHSVGFFLRIGNHIIRVRWSKHVKKLFTGYNKVNPSAYDDLFLEGNK